VLQLCFTSFKHTVSLVDAIGHVGTIVGAVEVGNAVGKFVGREVRAAFVGLLVGTEVCTVGADVGD
jgi:hypothetical protein